MQSTNTRWLILLLAALALAMGGCASVKYDTMSASEIYSLGVSELDEKHYDKATEAFEKLKEIHPFSVQVAQAEIRLADCYYSRREYEEAVAGFEEFLLRHPTHQEVPHALYYLGMSNYKRMYSIDRDQAYTKEAEKYFQRVVTGHPGSDNYPEAREKLTETRNRLAKRERYVGKFYFKQKEYYAALGRFDNIVQRYPDTDHYPEALLYAAKCQLRLGVSREAERSLKTLLLRFPDGPFASEARSLLKEAESAGP